jgi:hypothetical protein
MPETHEEWLAQLKNASDADIAIHRTRLHHGFASAKAAEQIFQEREARKKEEELQRMIKAKQERESEHTLWRYWCLADWSEKFGMLWFLFCIFLIGFGVAQIPSITKLLNTIKNLIP